MKKGYFVKVYKAHRPGDLVEIFEDEHLPDGWLKVRTQKRITKVPRSCIKIEEVEKQVSVIRKAFKDIGQAFAAIVSFFKRKP